MPDAFELVEDELAPPSTGAIDRLDYLLGLLHEARQRATRAGARVDKVAG